MAVRKASEGGRCVHHVHRRRGGVQQRPRRRRSRPQRRRHRTGRRLRCATGAQRPVRLAAGRPAGSHTGRRRRRPRLRIRGLRHRHARRRHPPPVRLLVPYFLAGLAGTLWLVEDAASLADSDADWQPNPWLYVVSGALVLEIVVALPVLRGEITTGIVPYLAGGLVLAGVLSSVVTGPIYFVRRRRNLNAA
ncbi:hypothetical protein [Halobacterium bonnevillei]|uniref:Uncharacterized protein n=1 Tax=Halobacterium bonnevillei TaxID=2692200 RepID=A0A6B0SJS3_9EURY|nr:hypothetical protein [Halobacterium bonnevillei]MXR21925.1 hypothetical protein [Halobacterium bonnevillei]